MYLQLADNEEYQLADSCGLKPLKPLRSREKIPAKWAEYDAKLAAWTQCRLDKGKGTSIIAAVALAPARALFSLMVDLNVDGIATKFAVMPYNEVRENWLKVGGDIDKLAKFINKGKGKKPLKIGLFTKFKSSGALADREYLNEDPTEAQKASIVAATTAAGTAIGSVVPGVGNIVGGGAGASLGALIIAILPFIKKASNSSAGDADVIPAPTPPLPTDTGAGTGGTGGTGIAGLPKWVLPIAGIAGLVAIYYFTKKKYLLHHANAQCADAKKV